MAEQHNEPFRQQLAPDHSRQQAKNVHDQVAAASAFLDWLTARGLTLASCTQAELDQ
jgi:hypothetical protein